MLSTAHEPVEVLDAAPAVRVSVPLEEAVRSWLADLRLANRSHSTVTWYRNVFEQRILPILQELGVRTVDQLERDHVRRLREAVQAQGKVYHGFQRLGAPARSAALSPATLHAYHRTIRAFYRWCVSEGYTIDRAATRLRIPKEPSREPRVFTASEVEAMLRVASVRDRLILEILVGTGLRVSELCALEVSDFRQDHPDGPYLNIQLGKGAKQRIVPLHGQLARQLRHYIVRERPAARSMALFLTERSGFGRDERQPLSRNAVMQMVKRLGERAGVGGERLSPHTFRHTFATRALAGGMDPLRLQRVLGHTTLSMVSRYVHFEKSDLLRGWDRYFETSRS